MPKEGPSKSEWRARLTLYANKEFEFAKGQHPSKQSFWGKEKEKIDACALSKTGSGKDLFGNNLVYSCKYHTVKV